MPKATAKPAKHHQWGEASTDARQWEYTTYAPSGETCPACLKPIKSLEACRRGMLARRDASPLVAYWHTDCAPKETAQ
ncbi:hypothetical protein AB0C13_00975 [Streptomyces sp. NPDC049099]|uniref:hypothetical protein n=1 Tax=Streptomyces sp. NPDC049099 TaxID=3155768 RepID=UPI00341F1D78